MLHVVKGKPMYIRGWLYKLTAALSPEARMTMLGYYLLIKPEVREFFAMHELMMDVKPFIVVSVEHGCLNVLFYVWNPQKEKVRTLEEAHLTQVQLDLVVFCRDIYSFHDEGDIAVMQDPPDFSMLKPVGKVYYREPVGMWTDQNGTLSPSLGISFPRETAI